MPPALACKFTVSELAVLRIVGDEVRQHGHCDRCVQELAARLGCAGPWSRTYSRGSSAWALTIEERRREGRRNLPNVIRIPFSKEWTSWLARGKAGKPSISRTANRAMATIRAKTSYRDR